jgi:hypothetical protein
LTSSLLSVRRGAQTPRVSNFPPYPLSAAPEVIDLAAAAGLHLDEWQQYVLTHGLGQRVDDEWTAKKVSCWVPRQNGKGGIIEALELAWLFLFDEELIIHSSHQHRTSARAYARLERIIRRTPDLHRMVSNYRQANGEQQIELHDGRMLQYTTRSEKAVRGFSTSKLILDEAQELTGYQMAAVLPSVSAMPHWQVWFFGTPPNDPTAWAYGLKSDGEAGIPRLAHFDWGAGDLDPDDPGDLKKINDLDTWYACNPALGIRIEIETVEDECTPSGLGDDFAKERLGVWKPRVAGAGVIPAELWRELAVGAEFPTDVAFAAVVNHKRTRTAIAAVGPREDGRLQASIVAYLPGTHWVVDKLVDLKARRNPVGVAVQDKGPSATLIEPLEEAGITQAEDPESPHRGDLAVPWANDVAKAYGLTIDAVTEKLLVHVDDGPLNLVVANPQIRPLGGGTTWDYKADPDHAPMQAVSLALWLWLARAGIDDDYDVADSFYVRSGDA